VFVDKHTHTRTHTHTHTHTQTGQSSGCAVYGVLILKIKITSFKISKFNIQNPYKKNQSADALVARPVVCSHGSLSLSSRAACAIFFFNSKKSHMSKPQAQLCTFYLFVFNFFYIYAIFFQFKNVTYEQVACAALWRCVCALHIFYFFLKKLYICYFFFQFKKVTYEQVACAALWRCVCTLHIFIFLI